MQYLKQFFIIAGFSLAGEFLKELLFFLPVPGSVYGLVLLFTALLFGVIKLESVEKVGDWLIAIMPVCFINPGVSIIEILDKVLPSIVPVIVISVVTTFLVFAVTGRVAQFIMKGTKKGDRN